MWTKNGLNDLDVCLSSLKWMAAYPAVPLGFSMAPVLPLSSDEKNDKEASDDFLVVIQAVGVLKAFALSIAGWTITL